MSLSHHQGHPLASGTTTASSHSAFANHTSLRSTTRPYSVMTPYIQSNASASVASKHRSLQCPPYNQLHSKASVSSFMTTSTTLTANYSLTSTDFASHVQEDITRGGTHLAAQIQLQRQRQAPSKELLRQQLKQQQRLQQKRALPLFPTERTRGTSSVQNALRPVDISQIDLLPIDFSRKVIMSCIDEIRRRGLRHKHLFRTPFYSPSVEAALKLLADPGRSHLASVKMMRMDTVGGLLTTVLSRTYPPLIPPYIQELFQNPKGRFFFELLALLPELNRFLFVELLDLCCDLVDNQAHNHISNSKLSVYPGSCCFGLDEYMPTWDTRYLLTADLKKFSTAFYHVIYAYREERDLSAEELKQKQIRRDQVLAEERLEALERQHGLEGAQIILRRESRIAKGLPPDSPRVSVAHLPPDVKEVSLYSGRRERIVADDAISVLDMQLQEGTDNAPPTTADVQEPEKTLAKCKRDEEEEENVEHVIADLRRSVSVASLGCLSPLSMSTTIHSSRSSTSTAGRVNVRQNNASTYATRPSSLQRPGMVCAKSTARFGSIVDNIYPVSPGDIFGISQHAIQRQELKNFLLVARTDKRRKSLISKRAIHLRLQTKLLRRYSTHSSTSSESYSNTAPSRMQNGPFGPIHLSYRTRNTRSAQRPANRTYSHSTYQCLKYDLAVTRHVRRERTRRIRKEIEVYQSQGLSAEEAKEQRKADLRRLRKQEKRAKIAAQERAEAEARALTDARNEKDVTLEEAEILEAFDYLTEQEFEEFMTLAGLTAQDVERIREKAAAAVLLQVTKDIQSMAPVRTDALQSELVRPAPLLTIAIEANPAVDSTLTNTAMEATMAATASFGSAYSLVGLESTVGLGRRRPVSIPHMNSMDLLLKNATLIGDGDLRCYPTRPSSPPDSNLSSESLLSRPAQIVEQQSSNDASAPVEESAARSEKYEAVVQRVLESPRQDHQKEQNKEPQVSSTESIVSVTEVTKEDLLLPKEAPVIKAVFSTAPTIAAATSEVKLHVKSPPSPKTPPQSKLNGSQPSKLKTFKPTTVPAAAIPRTIPQVQVGRIKSVQALFSVPANGSAPPPTVNYRIPGRSKISVSSAEASSQARMPVAPKQSQPKTQAGTQKSVHIVPPKLEKPQPEVPKLSTIKTNNVQPPRSTTSSAPGLRSTSTPRPTPASATTKTLTKPGAVQPLGIKSDGPSTKLQKQSKIQPRVASLSDADKGQTESRLSTKIRVSQCAGSFSSKSPQSLAPAAPHINVVEFVTMYEDPQDDLPDSGKLQLLDVDSDDNDASLDTPIVVENKENGGHDDEEEEAAELRELLESMTEDERQEFMRLSCSHEVA